MTFRRRTKVLPIFCPKNLLRYTSRERSKSAPYPRLKNSKRTSKFPSFGELGLLFLVIFFLKKSLTMPKKNRKGGPFGIFQHPFFCKTPKNWRGDPFVGKIFLWKKSRTVPKKSKGRTFWSRPVMFVTRETFLVQFLGPRGIFWGSSEFCRILVELFCSVQKAFKKTLTKSHDYSRLFS